MQLRNGFRSFVFIGLAVFLTIAPVCSARARQRTAPGIANPNVKIRAVTAFVNLDRGQYETQIADAVALLKRAQTIFESRGFPVETIRIATQPFPEYTKDLTASQAIAFFQQLDTLAGKDKFILAIGPAMMKADDNEAEADILADILRNTKNLSGTVTVAGEDGVHWKAVGAAARAMKKLENTPHSQGNFNFAAIAMVPPLSPFFPAAYNQGFGHQFAVGLESANVVEVAFRGVSDLDTAKQRLVNMLGSAAFEIQAQAHRVDMETGWRYAGMDLSPAPFKDISIGAAIEELTGQPFGSSGTLTAAATITAAIKSIGVQQTGFSGLMLPILEDSRLVQRWSEGRVSLDGLLAYSAVCGTGLDTVPLPGDVTEEQIDLIIGDMASLAVKWHKPLTARLLPVTDKHAGEMTEFADPYLVNAKVQALGPKE